MLCLSLLIVFIGNSSLNVAIPTLSRELQRDRVAAAVGDRDLLVGVRRSAVLDGRDRRPLRSQGRPAARARACSSSACIAASLSTSMPQLIACRAVMGVGAALIMPSTLSILVNVFPPTSAPRPSRSGPRSPARPARSGPVASGWLLDHFWYGVGVPRQRADHRAGAWSPAGSSCPSRRTPSRASSTRSARCCRSSGSSPSSTG